MPATRKRQAEPAAGRASKRQATAPTSTRLTRSAYRKLNENGETAAALNPGLPMTTRTRQRGKKPEPQPALHRPGSISTVAFALGIAADGQRVCIPMDVDGASRSRSLDDSAETAGPSMTAGDEQQAGIDMQSPTTVVYATGRTPGGEEFCMPITMDARRTSEDQTAPAPSPELMQCETYAPPVEAAPGQETPSEEGGPAPVPYMGGIDETLPADGMVSCAMPMRQPLEEISSVAMQTSSACATDDYFSSVPQRSDEHGPTDLDTCSLASSASTSCVSPFGPPRHRATIVEEHEMECDGVDRIDFATVWSLRRGALQVSMTKEKEEIPGQGPEPQPEPAIVRASYSIPSYDATELMLNEMEVVQEKKHDLESVVEIGTSSDPTATASEDSTMADSDDTIFSMEELDSTSDDSAELSSQSFEDSTVGSDEGANSTPCTSRSSPCSSSEPEPAAIPCPSMTVASCSVSARWQPQKMLFRDATGTFRVITSDQCPGAFPQFPWPYSGRSSGWSVEEDQYSVQEEDEDTVIW